MTKRYLRKKAVRERYGNISNRTLKRLVDKGNLPPPHYPTNGKTPFWLEAELDAADRRNTTKATAAA
jgi:hypothetical protein